MTRTVRLATVCTLAAVWTLPAATPAATQTVQGRISEDGTDVAVYGAGVEMLDASGAVTARATTDVTGGFLIDVPDGPTFRLRVTHIGYRTFTSDPIDRPGADVEIRIRLGVNAIALDPITVTGVRSFEADHLADFEARRTNPGRVGGHFVTREDIERRPVATPTQHVLGIAGVRVQQVITTTDVFGMDRSLIYLRHGVGGECLANVYVDGVRSQQSVDATMDDLLASQNIAGIEVYSRPVTVPPQYQGNQQCGSVLFWTGRPEGGGSWSLGRILTGTGLLVGLVVGSLLAIG